MKRLLSAAAVTTALVALSSGHAQAACGDVTIAEMTWNSAAVMAHVDKFVLENAFGCNAELVPGDTQPTGASMIEKGEPDIAPEMWSNSMIDALRKGESEGRLRFAGKSLSDGGEEGFWIPKYLADANPELATIEGIKAAASTFPHPESRTKGGFYGCPAGWNCQISANNLFTAFELEDAGFEMIDPGSGAGLSGSIAKAFAREEAWFGYYWAPTAVLGKYEMVKVDMGVEPDEAEFTSCTSNVDCLEPKKNTYPPSPVHTITTESFSGSAPEAYDYLTRRAFTNAQMNGVLAWMEDEQADGEIAMEYFMKTFPEIWTPWLSADEAAKVQAAVDKL